jgi:exoribonuclease-2
MYATWTSPIRKFGDMINHRLLKAVISSKAAKCPDSAVATSISECRRLNRMAERDVNDWLYAQWLKSYEGTLKKFHAGVIDVSRGGMRVRLSENGATAFIPNSFIHTVRNEIIGDYETGMIQIKGKTRYRLGDNIRVTIAEVQVDKRNILARLAD